jgi:hypothetical protein
MKDQIVAVLNMGKEQGMLTALFLTPHNVEGNRCKVPQ